ncbi:MAG: acyl-CoA thioesterase [Deltaproteobacteria bacterium]|jgi:acyl-CoA thioester hydrolase|nr:acyl-CoA thioesterase [Deltaproteobacteria bacterium]
MKRYPYFEPEPLPDGRLVEPLSVAVERVGRFEEVDALGMVWHGRYASYFEDARVALGERYGFAYGTLYAAGLVTPIRRMHVDYLAPLSFRQRCRITATLHWTGAARINTAYRIEDMDGARLTTGYTVQLFVQAGVTGDDAVHVTMPDAYAAFCERWKTGALR